MHDNNDKFIRGIHDHQNIYTNFKDIFISNFTDSWQGRLFEEFNLMEPLFTNDFLHFNNVVFDLTDVLSAINKSKLRKASGHGDVSAEYVKYADLLLSYRLANLFTACSKHGIALRNFWGITLLQFLKLILITIFLIIDQLQ